MKKIITLILILISVSDLKAQDYLEFVELKKWKSNFEFDGSWHYLTTEIYPFNFNYLKNGFEDKVRKNLQSIYIYAQIHGCDFDKIEYPLYFYQKKDKELNIRAADKVTLLEGLEIKNVREIRADLTITGHQAQSSFLSFISDQVDLLSKMKNPLLILKVMDRFKDFKDKITKGYGYSFTKTIQLYEDNSGERVYSVAVYCINTSNNIPKIFSFGIQDVINSGAVLDEDIFKKMIPQNGVNPFIVIVNKLSRAKESPISKNNIQNFTDFIIYNDTEAPNEYNQISENVNNNRYILESVSLIDSDRLTANWDRTRVGIYCYPDVYVTINGMRSHKIHTMNFRGTNFRNILAFQH